MAIKQESYDNQLKDVMDESFDLSLDEKFKDEYLGAILNEDAVSYKFITFKRIPINLN
jgi:hypothetical protein